MTTRTYEERRRLKEIADCPMVDDRAKADPIGRCNFCGNELPLTKAGHQSLVKRWCSSRCSTIFDINHRWTAARFFAILRARLPLIVEIARWDLNSVFDGSYRLPARCERCYGRTSSPEINHVVPRNGGGYSNGCHHHQTNLEPLCHPCHVAETTAQIRERRGLPPEGRVRRVEPQPESLWSAA